MNTTVSFAVQALISGVASRRLEWSGNIGVAVNNGYTVQELSFAAAMTVASSNLLSGISGVQAVAVVADGPLNVAVGNAGVDLTLTNTSLVVLTALLDTLTVKNTGSVSVNARIIIVS